MTPRKEFKLDTFLLRMKDIIIIGGAIFSFLIFGVRLYSIPQEVEAQAKTLNDHEKRIQRIEDSFQDFQEIKKMITSRGSK